MEDYPRPARLSQLQTYLTTPFRSAKSLALAAAEWKAVGPIEYWILGADEYAAEQLYNNTVSVLTFHSAAMESCMQEERSRSMIYSFPARKRGHGNRKSQLEAAHNGGQDRGTFSHNVPSLGLEAKFPERNFSAGEDQKTIS